ncbi:MAG: hypothetical protein IJU45_06080 [Clostridia bacterium]|nr:hypothetical protein [Clostridia bacterium]
MKRLIDQITQKLKIDKKSAVLTVIGTVGVIILVLTELLPFTRASPDEKSAENRETSTAVYEQELEKRLCSLLAKIDGAGEVKVMVTLECTDENVYASEEKKQSGENSSSSETKYIIVKSDGSESGMLLKAFCPQVRGVAVVCGGAGSAVVRRDITNAVSSVLGISPSKISVTAMERENGG